jgi:hypothetical protein
MSILAHRRKAFRGESDPYFSSVELLLHFDGADASTTFTDASTNSFVPTRVGSPVISTAQYKYGASSLNLTAGGDRLTYADHADLKMGTGDFTIELWARLTNSAATGTFFEKAYYTTGSISLIVNSSILYLDLGTNRLSVASGMSNNTWHHLAATRSGTTVRLFRDGTEIGSKTDSQDLNNTSLFMVGGVSGQPSVVGWIDEFRVTKGVARYTSAFTPPTAAFPNY